MGWHMKLVICVQLAYLSVCLTREMSVVREWTSLDVQLPPGDGQESRRSIKPSDVHSWFMYKDKVFVAMSGQPYSLAYLDLTDNSTSPLLRRYPSWEAHRGNENRRMIYNTNIVRVDRCDRIWAISVIYDRDDNIISEIYYKMTVFDLKTDSILRNSFIPGIGSSYDMTVDDSDCDNEYVYIPDNNAVWTYSWAEGDSWHHIFSDRIGPMILAPNSTVYFNVAGEPTVYYMSTTHLKDKSNKTSDKRKLGRSRKLNVHLYLSALDAKSDVLYYFTYHNRRVIHAVPCWTSERCSSNGQDDIVVSLDPTHELRYITVDENGYLWAITSRPTFEDEEIDFRLLSVPVRSTGVESNDNDTTNTITGVEPNTKDTTNTSTGVESNAKDTTNTSTGVESNTKDTTNTSTGVESNTKDTTNTSTGVESNTKDTTNTSTGVESNTKDTTNTSTGVESNTKDTTNTSTGVESNAKDTTKYTSTVVKSITKDTTNTSTGVESNAKDTTKYTSTVVKSITKDTTNTSTGVESNAKDTTNTSTGVESNAKDTKKYTSTGVESNAKDTTNTSTGVESNTKDTTNTSTGVESNAKDTTNTSTGVESNAKDTTNTTNMNKCTTAASSTTEQTSTLGSVHKHTIVNIADTTAETPNSNIMQAVGGTNMPYLLFSFANTTLNLPNFAINNNYFTYYNNFH